MMILISYFIMKLLIFSYNGSADLYKLSPLLTLNIVSGSVKFRRASSASGPSPDSVRRV